jgi:hypothetical protein
MSKSTVDGLPFGANSALPLSDFSQGVSEAMFEERTEKSESSTLGLKEYRVSNGPVVRLARSDSKPPAEFADAIELPRVYGAPLLFAIARGTGR